MVGTRSRYMKILTQPLTCPRSSRAPSNNIRDAVTVFLRNELLGTKRRQVFGVLISFCVRMKLSTRSKHISCAHLLEERHGQHKIGEIATWAVRA
jgi:hypothetical protein